MRRNSDTLGGRLGFPELHGWLTDSEFHTEIVEMEKRGRFRNERTCQAYIWSRLEQKIWNSNFKGYYQLDVELYGNEGAYPDISLCKSLSNQDYFQKKDDRTFYDQIMVWIELKHHPHVKYANDVIKDELHEDLIKCNKHSDRSCEGEDFPAYLMIICSGPGTFGDIILELEKGANERSHIIPIYMEE